MSTITAHGSSIEVTDENVTVHRGPMAQTLLPDVLTFSAGQLRGWYHHAPTATSPGWIQFSLSEPPAGSVERPVHGFPATRGAANIVTFAPGQLEEFTATHQVLVNLQAGYPLDSVTFTGAVGLNADDTKNPSKSSSSSKSTQQDALFPVEEQSSGASSGSSSGRSSGESSGAKRGNWRAVATPDTVPEPNTEADANNPVFGQNVTVTGDFAPYEKGEIWDMIAEAGGTVGKNVTKKTTMLVIGEWNSMTSKEKRARELKDKGQEITLWTFDEFLSALGKTRRPDIDDVKGTSAPF